MAARTSWLLLLLSLAAVHAEPLSMYGGHMRHQSMAYYAPSDRGCALCRNGENCSIAVHNQSSGVFCGDVLSTFQPCCCSFRNECMTTIFSDGCECFDGAREEEIMTTRFYLFVGLSVVAWVLLAYDKMCAGPYKVMNSNHQLLASSPSAAGARGADGLVDTVGGENTAAGTVAGDGLDEEDDTAPLRPASSSPSGPSAGVEVAVDEPQTNSGRQDGSSIQTV